MSFGDEPPGLDGGLLVVLTEEFEEFAEGGGALDAEVVADADAVVIMTPVSEDAPGKAPFSDPVP